MRSTVFRERCIRFGARYALIAAGVLTAGVIGVLILADGSPLTIHEASHALRAVTTDLVDHREPGFGLITSASLALSPGDTAARAPSLIALLAFMGGLIALGHRSFGPVCVGLALLVLTSSRPLIGVATQVDATTLILALYACSLALLMSQLDRRDRPGVASYALIPLGLAVFFCNPFAVVPLAVAIGAVLFAYRPLPPSSRHVLIAATIAAAVIAVVWMVGPWRLHIAPRPHAWTWPGREWFSIRSILALRAGPLVLFFALVGGLFGALSVRRLRDPGARRVTLAVWAAAMSHLALAAIPKIYLPDGGNLALALLVMLGAAAVTTALSAGRLPVVLGIVAAAFALQQASQAGTETIDYRNRLGQRTQVLRDVSAAIRADASGAPCRVVSAYKGYVAWYSGCRVYRYDPRSASRSLDRLTTAPAYALWFDRKTRKQPSPAVWRAIRSHLDGPLITVDDRRGGYGDGHVFRVVQK